MKSTISICLIALLAFNSFTTIDAASASGIASMARIAISSIDGAAAKGSSSHHTIFDESHISGMTGCRSTVDDKEGNDAICTAKDKKLCCAHFYYQEIDSKALVDAFMCYEKAQIESYGGIY